LNARRRSKCKLCCTFKQITIGPNWGYTIGKKQSLISSTTIQPDLM
jgi:hypothetical protein